MCAKDSSQTSPPGQRRERAVLGQHAKERLRRSRERWRDPLLTVLTIPLALLMFVIAPLHAARIIESQDVGLVVGLVVIAAVVFQSGLLPRLS